jgi:hypothetical protein
MHSRQGSAAAAAARPPGWRFLGGLPGTVQVPALRLWVATVLRQQAAGQAAAQALLMPHSRRHGRAGSAWSLLLLGQHLLLALVLGGDAVTPPLRPRAPYRMWSFSYNSTAPVDCFRNGNGHQTCGNKTIPTAVSTVSAWPLSFSFYEHRWPRLSSRWSGALKLPVCAVNRTGSTHRTPTTSTIQQSATTPPRRSPTGLTRGVWPA